MRRVRRSASRRRLYAGEIGEARELCDGSDAHLVHHSRAMHFDRFLGRPQASRDLFVQMSGDDVPEHLALSWRQRGEPLRHQPVFVLPGARLSVLLDGALDSRDEHVRFEWLLDKSRAPALRARTLD